MPQSARERAIMATIKNKQRIDTGDANSLVIHAVNDRDFFQNRIQPITDTVAKKMLKNKFNEFEDRKNFALKLGKEAEKVVNKDAESEDRSHATDESKIIAGNRIIDRIIESAGARAKERDPKFQFRVKRGAGSREEFLKEQKNVQEFLSR